MPSSAALYTSRMSEDTPDRPIRPLFLLSRFSVSVGVRCSLLAMHSTTAGSRSPERVPISTPSSGVRPMLVSTHLPLTTALRDEPLPRWHTMILLSLPFRPSSSIARADTKRCEVPWKP